MTGAATRAAPWVALVGPTGAGKSDLALALAEAEGWEILSLDSRRVYRRLDIGTAKPDAAARARVLHHMLDLVDPREVYDAHRYAADARAVLASLSGHGRQAVFEGGTGLYLQAIAAGGLDGPASDPATRAALHDELTARGDAALHAELAARDPRSAARLHPHDTFRVVRALEIARLTGRPASELRAEGLRARRVEPGGRGVVIVLSRDRGELDRRIAARWRSMVQAGLVEEVRALLRDGYPPGLRAFRAPGYREVVAHLGGEMAWSEVEARAIAATRRYAKRQLTWFRHQEDACWVDLGDCGEREGLARTRRALREKGVALRSALG